MDPAPQEVEGTVDDIEVYSSWLHPWNTYSPHDHSKGEALFNKVDPTMD
jgi:hypothetical protein